MKSIADQLSDVGAPVSDKKLTLRLIAGLDKRFKTHQEPVECMKPFPTFMQAQSKLQLAEKKLAFQAQATPQVLHTNDTAGSSSLASLATTTPAVLLDTWLVTALMAANSKGVAAACNSRAAAATITTPGRTSTATKATARTTTATVVAAVATDAMTTGGEAGLHNSKATAFSRPSSKAMAALPAPSTLAPCSGCRPTPQAFLVPGPDCIPRHTP
jgi:hypothetical protein